MSASFECRTQSTMAPEQLFDLSLDVDAHVESMAHSRERAVAGTTKGQLRLGEEVTWRAWHFGIPLRMTSRITELERPHSFTDEQVRGPFASFRHVHCFEPHDGGTLMTDRIEFAAPLGILGRIAEQLVLERYLRRLIEQRGRYLVGT